MDEGHVSIFEKPHVVLFDIGGVLIELNDPIEIFGVEFDEAEFHRRWLLSPAVREFERGRTTAEEFARAISAEFELSYSSAEFLKRFTAWPGPLFPHAVNLVRRIDPRLSCGILSNANALHWDSFGIAEAFRRRFDRVFLSFESGLLKPDREAFEQVIDSYECAPEKILYFDDNLLNVSAASELGINAVVCNSEAILSESLEAAGVLI